MGDLQSEKDKHWQWAREYKLVATPADFEEQSVDYDVEGAWKKLRAARADECWKFIQHHQNMYRAHLERTCAPACGQQEAVDQVTSLLSRHPQLYDASALEEQCARSESLGHSWSSGQSFVVKAEPASSQTGEGKVSPENLGISSGGVRSNRREEFCGSLATRGSGAQTPNNRRQAAREAQAAADTGFKEGVLGLGR